jgi:uncharacterized protein YjbI with pentapeptide repeats
MKRYLIALALLAGASSVAQAHCVGCSASGGTVFNGTSLNGLQFNGLQFNNWRLNGLQLNGVQFNGATAQGFDALQTKATDWSAVPLNQVQVRLPAAR